MSPRLWVGGNQNAQNRSQHKNHLFKSSVSLITNVKKVLNALWLVRMFIKYPFHRPPLSTELSAGSDAMSVGPQRPQDHHQSRICQCTTRRQGHQGYYEYISCVAWCVFKQTLASATRVRLETPERDHRAFSTTIARTAASKTNTDTQRNTQRQTGMPWKPNHTTWTPEQIIIKKKKYVITPEKNKRSLL